MAWADNLPEQSDFVDARTEAMGRTVVAHEAGSAIAVNPASLESVTAETVGLSVGSRFGGQVQTQLMVAAPFRQWTFAVVAGSGFGLKTTPMGSDGGPAGDAVNVISGTGGAVVQMTPLNTLSVGMGLRGARMWSGANTVVTVPVVDMGLIIRPPRVPSLQVGLAGVGLGASTQVLAGVAWTIDDELSGKKKVPKLTVAIEGGFGLKTGQSLGGGVDIEFIPALSARAGLWIGRTGMAGMLGLGSRLGPVRLDYTLARVPTDLTNKGLAQFQHTGTITVHAKERRKRALAILREDREERQALHVAQAVDAAAKQASETTSKQFAEATLHRVGQFVDAMADELDPVERVRARQLLDEAWENVNAGMWDVGQQMGLDIWELMQAHLELSEQQRQLSEAELEAQRAQVEALEGQMDELEARYLLAKRQAERAARAKVISAAAKAVGPQEAEPEKMVVSEVDRKQAENLFLQGMDLYTGDEFRSAAEAWERARELNPQLHGIDEHIANALLKAQTLESLQDVP
ncbi:MAG: hypothetical protein HN348_14210 [Proteobacteria bacterium]|nr:hypothetical protein [Pseudomonadota bacterium]